MTTPTGTPAEADRAAFTRRMQAAWFATADIPVEALEAGSLARLVAAAERAVANLDYLQELWGKEAITDGLASELRAALAALEPEGGD